MSPVLSTFREITESQWNWRPMTWSLPFTCQTRWAPSQGKFGLIRTEMRFWSLTSRSKTLKRSWDTWIRRNRWSLDTIQHTNTANSLCQLSTTDIPSWKTSRNTRATPTTNRSFPLRFSFTKEDTSPITSRRLITCKQSCKPQQKTWLRPLTLCQKSSLPIASSKARIGKIQKSFTAGSTYRTTATENFRN